MASTNTGTYAKSPILNDYKYNFISRRILSTLTGGLRCYNPGQPFDQGAGSNDDGPSFHNFLCCFHACYSCCCCCVGKDDRSFTEQCQNALVILAYGSFTGFTWLFPLLLAIPFYMQLLTSPVSQEIQWICLYGASMSVIGGVFHAIRGSLRALWQRRHKVVPKSKSKGITPDTTSRPNYPSILSSKPYDPVSPIPDPFFPTTSKTTSATTPLNDQNDRKPLKNTISQTNVNQSQDNYITFIDEDEEEINDLYEKQDGKCHLQIWDYIFPPVKLVSGRRTTMSHSEGGTGHKVVLYFWARRRRFFDMLLYGILASMCLWFLRPGRVTLVNPVVSRGRDVVIGFGGLSACFSLYSLMNRAPHEFTSIYFPDKWRVVDEYTRPFYLLLLCLTSFLEGHLFPTNDVVGDVLTLLFVTSPVLYVMGIFPPLRQAYFWFYEQVMIHLFGGTPASSSGRHIGYAATALLSWLGVFLGLFLRSPNLSAKLQPVDAVLWIALLTGIVQANLYTIYTSITTLDTNVKVEGWVRRVGAILYAVLVLSLPLVTAIFLNNVNVNSFATSWQWLIDLGVVALVVMTFLIGECQRPYLFFQLFRNPLYSPGIKLEYRALFYVYQACWFCMPAFTLSYLTYRTVTSQGSSRTLVDILFHSMWLMRSYRWCWQAPVQASTEMTILIALARLSQGTFDGFLEVCRFSGGMGDIHVAFFVVGIGLERVVRLGKKVWFMGIVFFEFLTNHKLRRKNYWAYVLYNVAALPLTLAFHALAATLAAPTLALFGLPIFTIGPLRPESHVSSTYEKELITQPADAHYYKQCLRSFLHGFHRAMRRGLLGHFTLRPGTHFVARWESRIMWIQITEMSFTSVTYLIKGLELQGTSCHDVEGRQLDDMLAPALNPDEVDNLGGMKRLLNGDFFHCMTPMVTLPVQAYSMAKTQLAGIIDHPQQLGHIAQFFVKSLVWLTMKNWKRILSVSMDEHGSSRLKPHSSVSNWGTVEFPTNWFRDALHTFSLTSSSPSNDIMGVISACFQSTEVSNFAYFGAENVYRGFTGKNVNTSSIKNVFQQNSQAKQALVNESQNDEDLDFLLDMALLPKVSTKHLTARASTMSDSPDAAVNFLADLTTKAFRYGVKLTYDQVAMGGMLFSDEDILECLADYETSWHMGNDQDVSWQEKMVAEVPNLFSMMKKDNSYHSVLLTLQHDLQVQVGELNSECVLGQQAWLAYELLYLTNDDDERYSIQANPRILSNLTAQSSDAPLGYPVYGSSITK